MRTVFAVLALVAATLWAATDARGQDPAAPTMADVMNHYRAYQEAYDAGDMAAAEVAARAALAAHEAAEPPNATRAVLAVNLVIVLVETDQGQAAQAALQALRALPQDTASVDPALLSLLQAHADLLADPQTGLPTAIEALSAGPFADDVLARRALFLAQDAGRAAMERHDQDRAQVAWRAFLAHTRAGDLPEAFLQGRGLTALGAALVMDDRDNEAFATFNQALPLLAPYAAETEQGPITAGQQAFAELIAWRAATWAKIESNGDNIQHADYGAWPPSLPDLPPPCPVRFNARPLPDWPRIAANRGFVGAAVMRYSLSEAGELSDLSVVAFVPDPAFAREVEQVADLWTVEISPREDAAPCRVARHGAFVPVMFTFNW